MRAGSDRFELVMEAVTNGTVAEMRSACEELIRAWKDVPVEPLLSLKEQFHRLDLEHREAHIDEALISIAEKRPGPFTSIATEPAHPLWRPAVEVLSMAGDPGYMDLFISLLPMCPRKNLKDLVRAIGNYRDAAVVEALRPYLSSEDEGVFFEAVTAFKRNGGPGAAMYLKKCLDVKRREGSLTVSVLESVIQEMENGRRPIDG